MPRRRSSVAVASEAIVITEPLPLEDLQETTVEDYKKLNEKVDKVMSKIKVRKERKQIKK
jgi:hypothetical protein